MRKLILYITLFATLSLSSCNDWLNVKPEAQTDEKDMFKTVDGFKNALTACYIKLNSKNLYGLSLTITDIEYMAQHWTYMEANYRNQQELKEFKYENSYPKTLMSTIYGEIYNTIVQANIILKNIPEYKEVMANEDVRATVEAEALAIRAFCHLDILRLFGQMPQNATTQVALPYAKTVSIEAIPYYSYKDFTDLILADLEAAETLLKDRDPLFRYSFQELDNYYDTRNYDVELDDQFLAFRRFRFNYYAVKAIRARLYMYMGEKTKAYAAAKEIIDAVDKNGKKVLELAGAEDINKSNFALPSECILALSNYEIKENIGDLFASDNPAIKLYLTENQFTNDLFAGQSVSANNRVQVWDRTPDIGGDIKPLLKKYNQPSSTTNMSIELLASQKQVIPLIRLSEMYLIAIESAPTLAEANILYSSYMAARNVEATPLSQEQLSTEIMREYRREFFGEGQMFYTYKRLGVKNMLWKTDREVGEQDYVVPLPSTENAN